eukprot:scaffold153_cov105-Isochrysis_galbana.AAC.3
MVAGGRGFPAGTGSDPDGAGDVSSPLPAAALVLCAVSPEAWAWPSVAERPASLSSPKRPPRTSAIWACMARISAIISRACSASAPAAGSASVSTSSSSSSSIPMARLYSRGSSDSTGLRYISSRHGHDCGADM